MQVQLNYLLSGRLNTAKRIAAAVPS